MGLAHEKKSYLQEKANLFEIGSYVSNNIQGCSEMNMILFWNTLDNIESSANIFLMASFFINQRLPVNSLSASLLTSTTAMPIFLHSSQG